MSNPAAPVESPVWAPTWDVQICRVCGCNDFDCRGCIEKTGEPCAWAEPDLCTACVDEDPGERPFSAGRPTLVVAAAVRRSDHDRRVLVGYHHGGKRHKLPGGKVEAGESVEDALRRELFEETGLRIYSASLVSYKDTTPGWVTLLFSATAVNPDELSEREPGEFDRLAWCAATDARIAGLSRAEWVAARYAAVGG